MKKYALVSSLICCACILQAQHISAQRLDGLAYGITPTRAELSISDMLTMSQYNQSFGTARSTAMGGAFVSLGADLSSLALNPAGLGMYRSSEIVFSPVVNISHTETRGLAGTYTDKSNRRHLGINNFAMALNLYEGAGALTSFTLGFGYNKVADLNYNITADINAADHSSIAHLFTAQLHGINSSILTGDNAYNSVGINRWGAVLGYGAYFIDNAAGSNTSYVTNTISNTADIYHYMHMKNTGSIGEYSVAAGFNFRNVVYLGFAIGLQDINHKQEIIYTETYDNNTDARYPIRFMDYDQRIRTSGTGVNFKIGVTVRPTDGLRIGAAVHTPTIVSITKKYDAGIYTYYHNSGEQPGFGEVFWDFEDNFITPTRLMVGASYTLGKIAVLSADYEHTFYTGMRLTGDSDAFRDEYKEEVRQNYKGSHNFRIGAEVKPVPAVALRAGYALFGSMLRNEAMANDIPIAYRSYNISFGMGIRVGARTSVDWTYVFMEDTMTNYQLYAYTDNSSNIQSQAVSTGRKRHNILFSLSYRF